jgi:signal transduction histidine kinase
MELTAQAVSGPQSSQTQNQEHLRLLIETGLLLASERSLDFIVQTALDAGLHLSGARFGGFFYNNLPDPGLPGPAEPYLYKAIGLESSAFAALPIPCPAEIFDRSLLTQGIVRYDDITHAPDTSRLGNKIPLAGLLARHAIDRPPVRSYLAVPVRGRSRNVFGALVYAHPEANIFAPSSEGLVATIASQAAVAIDNVRLAESLTREISLVDAARSLQRETAIRLAQALDAAQLGTWTWDRASDLLDLDERAAELFHVAPHVPISRTALREHIVFADDLPATREKLQRALESGGLYNAEYRVDDHAGLQTWISASGIATFASGSPAMTGMVGTIQNITGHKNQEAALRQSEKLAATGRLAATIAHEINNPLEAVTNLIYLSRTDPDVPAPVQLLLETADIELARVAQIAQQTLGFYRDTTRPGPINLNQLLQSVTDLFARKMSSHKIDCKLDLEEGLTMYGLQGEMRQVFSNLVVNAIDAFTAVPKSGRLHIRGRRRRTPSGGVSILISDDGTGIPAHVRERIFSPFFTTKQSVGTGLGLWVTRGFVEKHGGHIHFRTRTGHPSGTTFRIYLPSSPPSTDSTVRYQTDAAPQTYVV